MERRHANHRLLCHARIIGKHRGNQRAFAKLCQRHRLFDPLIGHHRRHRTKGLDIMHRRRRIRLGAIQQDRIKIRPLPRIPRHDLHLVRVARDDFGVSAQIVDARAHLLALREAGERAHPHPLCRRIAQRGFAQPLTQGRDQRIDSVVRRDHPTDSGAFLPGLDRHLARDFLDEQVELDVVGVDVGGENRAVQRIGLGVERHRMAHQARVHAQLGGGRGRAGEGDHVLAVEAVEQVAGAADDQLQAARRQHAALRDEAHRGLGQIAGRSGRLDDARHSGEKTGREFLEHAPDGEVERVDVHRDAAARHQDVAAGEAARLAQRQHRAFVHDVARRQPVAADAGVRVQRADAALDVDPAVGARRAGVARYRVQRFLVRGQVRGQRLQARGALLEVQRQQRRHAASTEIDGLAEVDRLGVGVGDDVAVDRAAQRGGGVGAEPALGDQALQGVHDAPWHEIP
ncbi:hypothetical protein GALL_464550 [mine drainage metagenome]|uniref:Uncharacterized protein n=1 Tax=mine drainage metagenome TaxID=410659 RepID=A0A1J5PWI8_9ZZZZ